ncbi:squalene/phytoene synthase family protein [Tranquillimonas alkanivorans]|uniref:Farnesyl-diphosphate farnesyltransferase n=1 Tax=Tranquillimonas alkanivorans TaxID=441119 RepID=A0A1I5QT59_9RHOB|nr:squalene/phytoene synthase family protein [Tranquillimonas alkanivorans]SFP49257.1 farnesyl-diphosphate farnesyltransferase [Tranquillimonas alkanivorans]
MTLALPTLAPREEVRRIVAASGSSFTTGMRILPAERRAAIFAVYAFCRCIDDVADGGGTPTDKARELDGWAHELDRVFDGRPSTAVGVELERAIAAYDLPREEFELVLDGMRMDAEGMVAPSPERLEAYVRRVAGAVGILSMRIFGAWRGEPSRRFALSLARGMQFTNILRDVAEDAEMGRLYLPAPLLEDAGLPLRPMPAARHPELHRVRRTLGAQARAAYDAAAAEIPYHSRARLLPALVMMGPYDRLLARMEADWTARPARLPGWRKAVQGLRCAAFAGPRR